MTYIVQRKDRFYVVSYDGLDPLTGKERRRWHPTGYDRAEAEAVADSLGNTEIDRSPKRGGSLEFGAFLTETWLPQKRRQVRSTTAYRYSWMIHRYVIPALGAVPVRRLRADHLDSLYEALANTGGKNGNGLAPKTVHEVHMIVRAALDSALKRGLLDHNVAHATANRMRHSASAIPRVWTAPELAAFLEQAKRQRLYPALHLAAHTGMRRGELVGLKWSDLDRTLGRLSISRTLQNVGGKPTEFGVKTRTSRRNIDLDRETVRQLDRWRQRLDSEGLPNGPDDWMFCNSSGRFLNPESVSQLFERVITYAGLPRIRFHDLRHTHASLLVVAGVPIKVVTERLGHAHPGFTMHTYQHLLPGMSANQFAALIAAANR